MFPIHLQGPELAHRDKSVVTVFRILQEYELRTSFVF
jgi:hypothetical protein